MTWTPSPAKPALPKGSRIERWLSRHFRCVLMDGFGRCPYLLRWHLWHETRVGSAYIHKFIADDWSLDLHDHSSRFISIGLSGSYAEDTPAGTQVYRAPWVRTFPASHVHRLRLVTPTVWTLAISLPRSRRSGFWVDGRWQVANAYSASRRAQERKSC